MGVLSNLMPKYCPYIQLCFRVYLDNIKSKTANKKEDFFSHIANYVFGLDIIGLKGSYSNTYSTLADPLLAKCEYTTKENFTKKNMEKVFHVCIAIVCNLFKSTLKSD